MKNHPVKTVTKAQLKSKAINLDIFPSAGPRANVTGMKNKYWGKDAYIIRSGAYIYKVNCETYHLF